MIHVEWEEAFTSAPKNVSLLLNSQTASLNVKGLTLVPNVTALKVYQCYRMFFLSWQSVWQPVLLHLKTQVWMRTESSGDRYLTNSLRRISTIPQSFASCLAGFRLWWMIDCDECAAHSQEGLTSVRKDPTDFSQTCHSSWPASGCGCLYVALCKPLLSHVSSYDR